jgi:hypothetical protein
MATSLEARMMTTILEARKITIVPLTPVAQLMPQAGF